MFLKHKMQATVQVGSKIRASSQKISKANHTSSRKK